MSERSVKEQPIEEPPIEKHPDYTRDQVIAALTAAAHMLVGAAHMAACGEPAAGPFFIAISLAESIEKYGMAHLQRASVKPAAADKAMGTAS